MDYARPRRRRPDDGRHAAGKYLPGILQQNCEASFRVIAGEFRDGKWREDVLSKMLSHFAINKANTSIEFYASYSMRKELCLNLFSVLQ